MKNIQLLLLLASAISLASSSNTGLIQKPTTSISIKKKLVKQHENAFVIANNNQAKSDHIKGVLSVIGGALAHLTLGTLYCWANFGSYSPQNLRFFDGKIHDGQPDSLIVMPLAIIAQCLTLPFGPSVVKKIGASKTLLLGSWIMALGVFLSSYAQSLSVFIACYSLLFGAGIGIAYTAPMLAGYKWLPNSKGLVSGGVLAGFGLGGFFFNLIGTKLVNPKGLNPIKGVFPQEVYDNFSPMLRKLSLMYAGISLIGSLLVTEPASGPAPVAVSVTVSPAIIQNQKNNIRKAVINVDKKLNTNLKSTLLHTANKISANTSGGVELIDAVRSSQFWYLWLMIITSGSTGLNVASTYKQFANAHPMLAGDSFQALVGGLGALFNGGARLVWGSAIDKIGFRASFLYLTILQTVIQLGYAYSGSSKV